MTERHRPSEPFSPRPSDLLADRLRVLAAWAAINDARVTFDGAVLDSVALERLAQEQACDEATLLENWSCFRTFYAGYTKRLKERERMLLTAINALSGGSTDSGTKQALRLCRLRRPPLAKVSALVAQARLRTATGG